MPLALNGNALMLRAGPGGLSLVRGPCCCGGRCVNFVVSAYCYGDGRAGSYSSVSFQVPRFGLARLASSAAGDGEDYELLPFFSSCDDGSGTWGSFYSQTKCERHTGTVDYVSPYASGDLRGGLPCTVTVGLDVLFHGIQDTHGSGSGHSLIWAVEVFWRSGTTRCVADFNGWSDLSGAGFHRMVLEYQKIDADGSAVLNREFEFTFLPA